MEHSLSFVYKRNAGAGPQRAAAAAPPGAGRPSPGLPARPVLLGQWGAAGKGPGQPAAAAPGPIAGGPGPGS